MKSLFVCFACLFALAGLCPAVTCQLNRSKWAQWVDEGEPYSLAICDGVDPQVQFEQERSKLNHVASTPALLPMFLVHTAMAALEAGLPDEAKSYAEKALAARESPPFLHARPVSFEADSLGAATSLANVVLGRLALPKGDIEDAEQRLLLSVQVNTGFGPFWGPNMTLARELLKRHRSEAVLKFLDIVSSSWRWAGAQEQLTSWKAAIQNGKIPDFGANLLYR